jgi:hypothetical protein
VCRLFLCFKLSPCQEDMQCIKGCNQAHNLSPDTARLHMHSFLLCGVLSLHRIGDHAASMAAGKHWGAEVSQGDGNGPLELHFSVSRYSLDRTKRTGRNVEAWFLTTAPTLAAHSTKLTSAAPFCATCPSAGCKICSIAQTTLPQSGPIRSAPGVSPLHRQRHSQMAGSKHPGYA